MALEIGTVFDAATAFVVLAATVVLAGLVALIPVRRASMATPDRPARYVRAE
jgi:hypothetical protein